MANTIKLKRGTSTPSTSDIASGEVAIDTSAKKLYINDSGTVKEIGGGGITINNNADNRIITGSGTANTLNGESNFTFDGTNLVLAEGVEVKLGTSSNLEIISISGNKARIQSQQEDFHIETAASKSIVFRTNRNGTNAGWDIETDGDFVPSGNKVVDIGSSSKKVDQAYIADINCEHIAMTGSIFRTSTGGAIGSSSYKFSNIYATNFHGDGSNLTNISASDSTKLPLAGGTITGDLTVETTNSNNFLFDNSDNALLVGDSTSIKFGAGTDFQLSSDGTNDGGVLLAAGTFRIASSGSSKAINIMKGTSAYLGRFITDGGVELYHNGTKKAETVSGGFTVSGTCTATAFSGDGSSLTGISATDSTKLPLAGGTLTGNVIHNDGVKALFGTSSDLQIFHNGSHSIIADVGTGNLQLRAADFRVTDSTNTEVMIKADTNGAVELYDNNLKRFETTADGCLLGDSRKLQFGDGPDLEIYSDGSNSFVKCPDTGNNLTIESDQHLYIKVGDSEDAIKCVNGQAVELFYDGVKRFETTSYGSAHTGVMRFENSGDGISLYDSRQLKFGNGDDLKIWHNATSSYISNNTGNLYIESKSGETAIQIVPDGAVDLRYNGSKKFETTSTGTTTTGNHVVSGLVACDGLLADDNEKIKLGSGEDLQIYHNGSASYIQSPSHTLYIQATTIDIGNGAANEAKAKFIDNGAVELYYDNSLRLSTASDGVHFTNGHLRGGDNNRLILGTGQDLHIYHDGLNSFIHDSGTGNLYVRSSHLRLEDDANDPMITAIKDGAVELYFNNSKKLETYSDGVSISGSCLPSANNSYDLGSSSLRWRNIYTNDLNLSNEGGSNDVDGTWGDWTLQEGDKNIFMINNRTGKKYRMNLTEVS